MTCNRECTERAAEKTRTSYKEVEEVVKHFLSFTDRKIREGMFEGVRFPYLGAVKPRTDYIQKWFDKLGEK